jgi:cell division protein FtsX
VTLPSLTFHASLTVIAMHIDGIASFITLPVAMVLVVTLVLLIATAVLVTLALRRDGD